MTKRNSKSTPDLSPRTCCGVAKNSEQLIHDLGLAQSKILFVTDEIIWQNCARFFPKNFLQKNHKNLILKNPKPDEKNLKKIAAAVKNCDFILALGSGTINDLCKYTSAEKNIPYAIFASAASMNGYLSKNASITISGHKKTLPATLPKAVFCDLKILKAAPVRLTKAGIGDSLCFYSCWFDWYLSHKILGTKFDERPFEILQKKMDFLIKNFEKFSLRDEEFLKLLIEILLLSGRGMTMSDGSYPASQSEHLVAHTIEMKHPKIAEKKLHGEMIAVTTLTSARLQQELLQHRDGPRNKCGVTVEGGVIVESRVKVEGAVTVEESRIHTLDCHPALVAGSTVTQAQIKKFFGKKTGEQCQKEYTEKLTAITKAQSPNWPEIKKELQKIHFPESHLKTILTHFKIKTSPKSLRLSKQEYQSCVTHAKFIRNRFTCLDLL